VEKLQEAGKNYRELPYSIRLCFHLLLLILIGYIIIACSAILIPLYFSVLISILLLPLTTVFERAGLSRAPSAILSVLMAMFLIVTVIYLLSAQIVAFLNDIPSIKIHLADHYQTLQHWLEQSFNLSVTQQKVLVNSATAGMQDSGIVYIKETFFTLTTLLAFIIFTFIYSFLILFYRRIIKSFLFAVFNAGHRENVDAVITGSQQILKKYMGGLLIEMVIVSTCNSILFLAIGIKYAIFLGVLTGVLNILPYVGIYSGMIFTALITLTTAATMSQIAWIFIGLWGIHFIDSNFLMPRIVGSKVKINALITMLGAISGGLLIGIPGVFLALPTIAILKIIFDRIDELKPWGKLLGDDTPATTGRPFLKFSKLNIKRKKIVASPSTQAV
jgi:predicted PurR-regulated permease PerM